MVVGYKCNYRKFPGFISTEGAGSTEPDYTYLSHFPEIYYNFYVCPIVHPHFLSRYFNDYNAIDNNNSMQQSNLVLDKYWVT